MRDDDIEIRSFRAVFDLERRIHKIDRWRIPLPYGLPLRSIAYAVAALVAVLMAQRCPGVGALLGALPVPARYVVLPCAAAWLLTRAMLDGRPAHVAAVSAARFLVGARCLAGGRAARWRDTARVADLVVVPDERSPRMRPAVIRGPASVLLRHSFGSRQRRRTLIIEPSGERARMSGTRVRLQRDQRLVIR